MEKFLSIFKNKIKFFYSSWDRMVINGYLTTLFRPEQLVYFFHTIAGRKCITKEVLKERTEMYNAWVKSYAANHKVPILPAQKGDRKEDFVLPYYTVRSNKKRELYVFSSPWNRTVPFVPTCLNIQPKIPIIGLLNPPGHVSCIITSTFSIRLWVP